MHLVKICCATLIYAMAPICVTACASGGFPVAVSDVTLRNALTSDIELESLDGKKVTFKAPVFVWAPAVAIADLRMPAKVSVLEESGLSFGKDCVDLLLLEQDGSVANRSRIATITGEVKVLDSLASDVATSLKSDGVTFAPKCGYFSSKYVFVRVSRLEFPYQ